MSTSFGFTIVAAEMTTDAALVERITGGYVAALEALGGERLSSALMDDPRPLFLLVATGGAEKAILEVRSQRSAHALDEPVFLIAHPGNNALPASLEVLARCQQEGAPGRIFYLDGPEDEAGLRQIATAARDLSVRRALRESRIGLIGDPSDWLVASMPNPAIVQEVWGPEVAPIAMEELTTRLAQIPDEALESHLDDLTSEANEIREPSAAELREVVRVSAALRELVDEHDLDALTLRCFDLVLKLQTTGCFGLAALTDEGIIAGCEGDLVSTVGMLWAAKLLDATPWMANPAQVDVAANVMWLAHCTVPRTLVERYRLRSHFESGLGVGIQGMLPAGPVTLLRIGGVEMRHLWLAEGEIVAAGEAENLCRTQAQVQLTRGDVADLLRAPLGNHLVLVRGHHADRLHRWWKALI